MVAYTFYESDNRVRRYAESLVHRGARVDAIVLRRVGQSSFEVISGVNVHRLQSRVRDEQSPLAYLIKLLGFFLRSTWVITRNHLKERYDIIHVHSVPDFQVFSTIIPRLMGARIILDVHDIVPELYGSKFNVRESSLSFRILLLIEKLSMAFADHVIIANDLWYTKLTQRSVQAANCTVIINYPDPSIFSVRPSDAAPRSDFVLCYPGSLNWHQGVDLAISAMALLRDRAPHIKFLIIGDGPERNKLKATVKQQHLENHVKIVGSVPIEQVAQIMSNVDLGVVPKRSDSFGNEAFSTKIMEFMAMGVPVLVSSTRIDRYYFNETLVQFFDPGNTEDLAAKILELAHNAAKRSGFRNCGLKFIQQNNWDVKKGTYFSLIDQLLKGRAP